MSASSTPTLRGRSNVPRGEWLTRYATSLAFLVGLVTLPGLDVGSPTRRQRAEAALEAWRQYLLAPRGTTPPSVHELLFLNGRTMVPPLDIPAEQQGRYFMTCIDPTVVASSQVMGVYSKLPGMLIWSPIEPQDRVGWRGTRINGIGQLRANKQMVTAPFLTDLVRDRIRAILAQDRTL